MNKAGSLPCYVSFNSRDCTGCGACVKVCPTKAIRIKDGKSILLVDSCIGGGECIGVCPRECITPITYPYGQFKKARLPVVLVPPVLYSQFAHVPPKKVLAGLKRMGFKHTVDMSYFLTMFKKATEQHIQSLGTPGEGRPVISTLCPVVLRLIAFRFPSLMGLLHPVLRPVSLMVKDVATFLARHHGVAIGEISIFYLNPCSTKMTPESSTHHHTTPYPSRTIGINQIYAELKHEIKSLESLPLNSPLASEHEFEFEEPPTGSSLLWAISGGETAGTTIQNSIAISGMDQTIEYLEKLELGLFKEYDFIEFRTCREGCVGGPLCAVDKYGAKNNLLQHIARLEIKDRHEKSPIKNVYAKERFFDRLTSAKMEKIFGQKKEPLSIADLTNINQIYDQLPGFNCSACGAPDCRTFAEDVVRGRAALGECRILGQKISPDKRSKMLKVKDLKDRLNLVLAAGEEGLDRSFSGGYCGDLLSDVMANALEHNVWLTVQAHQNIVAVAVLKEISCIIITCGNRPDQATCRKADEEKIPLFLSDRTAFDLAAEVGLLQAE
ncbi:MAG: [Fe-Fe] hydrogenase large subunit C-terminal domain-containing protein [Desulfobacterium sp.]|jgi:Na+-translocating ferredoxin:NAD+ oxidoreductase RNF subunit RnfB|nr:[Fe-Fe] hydrogenase large subunit C-terminal domain-containing protein [Desulfobacterium sp.]